MLLIHHVSIVAAILLFVLEVLTVSGDGSKPTNQIIKVKKVRQKEGSQRGNLELHFSQFYFRVEIGPIRLIKSLILIHPTQI